MIKRNSRNVGKKVIVVDYHKDWNGRTGKVVGFRGDFCRNDPNVNIFVHSLKSVWTLPGHNLKQIIK